MAKSLGCAGGLLGLMVTGILFVLLSMVCFGVMAGIGEAVLPGEAQHAYRRWLQGRPPDHPAFQVVTADTFSTPLEGEGCLPAHWPLSEGTGFFTQPFHDDHHGVDVGVVEGTPVAAPLAGTVVWAGWEDTGYGNLVIVAAGAVRTYLAHLSSVAVEVGQVVSPGDLVGLSGNTGRSTGPHLHYEVRVNGVAVDPLSQPGNCQLADGEMGTGGGAAAVEPAAAWRLPPAYRGWLQAAPVAAERAGLAPDEAAIRIEGPVALLIWPVDRPELAVQDAAAIRDHSEVAVGPRPGEVWATFAIAPAHVYLLSVWEVRGQGLGARGW